MYQLPDCEDYMRIRTDVAGWLRQSHLPCHGYNVACSVSGIINDFKALGNMLFRWNVRRRELTGEYYVAQPLGKEITSDEL
jgi:hypothetical protein